MGINPRMMRKIESQEVNQIRNHITVRRSSTAPYSANDIAGNQVAAEKASEKAKVIK